MNTQDVVLLGASNLVLGWSAVMESLREVTPEPLNLNVALGMGRSYIKTSTFLFRQLPGIGDCGLWDHLPSAPTRPPLVLITDLGNDIVYLMQPDRIATSVRECIQRILAWRSDAEIVITGLPMASLMRVGRLQFLIARSVMFPGCTLSQTAIYERSNTLDQLVRNLAAEFGIKFVEPKPDWYGLDPIHVLAKSRSIAFRTYFAAFGRAQIPPSIEPQPCVTGIRLPTAARRTVLGRPRFVQQPVYHSTDVIVSAW